MGELTETLNAIPASRWTDRIGGLDGALVAHLETTGATILRHPILAQADMAGALFA
ncbi:hypothetical protein [Roseovarius tolerans]|uniref:hypothetical protein n=1 Tax=Roseovarius tolerans TaxID=74031 RepID=UPI001F1F6621|nr:hypothetical protein [Roseovarius tolerans]